MAEKKPYDVCMPETYTTGNGEEKTKFHQVGVAFDTENGGMSVIVPDGISLSGRFVILPRKERAGNDPSP